MGKEPINGGCMSKLLHVNLAAALMLAGTIICGTAGESPPLAFECRVDSPASLVFGGAAWRRDKDDELTLAGTIGWNAKDICDTCHA